MVYIFSTRGNESDSTQRRSEKRRTLTEILCTAQGVGRSGSGSAPRHSQHLQEGGDTLVPAQRRGSAPPVATSVSGWALCTPPGHPPPERAFQVPTTGGVAATRCRSRGLRPASQPPGHGSPGTRGASAGDGRGAAWRNHTPSTTQLDRSLGQQVQVKQALRGLMSSWPFSLQVTRVAPAGNGTLGPEGPQSPNYEEGSGDNQSARPQKRGRPAV